MQTEIWETIQEETLRRVQAEPVLASFFHTTVLEHHSLFSSAVADLIANDLGSCFCSANDVTEV